MKVFTLRGSGKSGKTTTIKYLKDTYLINHRNKNDFFYQCKNDFTAVYEIRMEQKKHKIIVTSYGDKKEILCQQLLKVYNFYFNTTLRDFEDIIVRGLNWQGFVLFICASRTHGETCDLLEDICDGNVQNLKVIKKEKKYDDKEKAEEMYNGINKMLSHNPANS